MQNNDAFADEMNRQLNILRKQLEAIKVSNYSVGKQVKIPLLPKESQKRTNNKQK